jgi:transcriptional regulator with XRE-family HTH domain
MTPTELRQICLELGWTQKTAAERLGVTLRTYGYYEAGTTSSGAKLEHVPKAVAIAMRAYRFAQQVERAQDDLGHDLMALGDEIEHLARDFAEELGR